MNKRNELKALTMAALMAVAFIFSLGALVGFIDAKAKHNAANEAVRALPLPEAKCFGSDCRDADRVKEDWR